MSFVEQAALLPPSPEVILAGPDRLTDAWCLLQEYFEEVQVMVRDEKDSVEQGLSSMDSAMWVAYVHGKAVGCIALRPLKGAAHTKSPAGEIKRLYVRSAFRKLGLARLLLKALEAHARTIGLRTLYLDSKDDLVDALRFYERSGYSRCPRYNDNPQATLFLNKSLVLKSPSDSAEAVTKELSGP